MICSDNLLLESSISMFIDYINKFFKQELRNGLIEIDKLQYYINEFCKKELFLMHSVNYSKFIEQLMQLYNVNPDLFGINYAKPISTVIGTTNDDSAESIYEEPIEGSVELSPLINAENTDDEIE